MSYAEELRVKRARVADALRRIGGLHVEVPPVLGADSMVRNKATLPLAERGGRVEPVLRGRQPPARPASGGVRSLPARVPRPGRRGLRLCAGARPARR